MAIMTMRCAKCGAEIPEGSPVCRSCFEPVKPEGLFSRLRRAFGGGPAQAGQSSSPPAMRVNVKVKEKFKIRDSKTGEVREYQSLDDLPVEYREKIRQARDAADRSDRKFCSRTPPAKRTPTIPSTKCRRTSGRSSKRAAADFLCAGRGATGGN
jgi:hypothetical protein